MQFCLSTNLVNIDMCQRSTWVRVILLLVHSGLIHTTPGKFINGDFSFSFLKFSVSTLPRIEKYLFPHYNG